MDVKCDSSTNLFCIKNIHERTEKRRLLERQARQYVEEMALEEAVTFEQLHNYLQLMTPEQYENTTEERLLSKRCGLPLCSNPHSPSTEINVRKKVHQILNPGDIRHRFCSKRCYDLSMYIHRQIPLEPLWFQRGVQNTFTLHLPPSN